MSSKTLHAFVSGKVQRVYYRASLQREALRLGLTGFVRNLPDGRVEYLAQGPATAVDALLEWSRSGPPHAEVANVEQITAEQAAVVHAAELAEFVILR